MRMDLAQISHSDYHGKLGYHIFITILILSIKRSLLTRYKILMLKMTDITFMSYIPGPQKGSKSAVLFGCFYCHSFYPAYFDINELLKEKRTNLLC